MDFVSRLYQYKQVAHRPAIYTDESSFSADTVKDRGYSSIGAGCYGGKDWPGRGRKNAISAIHNFKILNMCLFEENVNAGIFHAWTAEQLIPSLPENSVVVMDNASFHKGTDTLNVLRAHGHDVLFLPPYSPDLNPVEKKRAQAKMIRKKHRCNPYKLFQ